MVAVLSGMTVDVTDRFRLFVELLMLMVIVVALDVQCKPSSSSSRDGSWLASKIDAASTALHECVRYPGLTVAIVRSKDPRHAVLIRNYGVRNMEQSSNSVDDDTRFCIGSVTKTFTAALLTQLLHDNKTYSLDTPVKDILGPDFELCDEERTNKTNARDLLAHRVGVAKHYGAFLLGYNLTRANIVRRVRHLPALKPFRSSRIFNNFMYVIAGQLAERMNGTWWESQIVWKFLSKLKMTKTTFADRVGDWNFDFALPHALDKGKVVPLRSKVTGNVLRPVGPAGSMCTTSTDMASWIQMLLRNGTNFEGDQVLNPEVVQDLFRVHNPFTKSPYSRTSNVASDDVVSHFKPNGYGLGWVIGTYRNRTRAFHSGFSNYYHSMVSLLSDDGIGIFTALNGPHLVKCDNGMKALHLYITDLLLGEKPWLNPTNICQYPRKANRSTTITSRATSTTSKTTTAIESGTTDSTEGDDQTSESPSTTIGVTEPEEYPSTTIGDNYDVTTDAPSPIADASVTTWSTPSNSTSTPAMSFGSRLRAGAKRRVPSRRRRPSRDVPTAVARNSRILSFLQPFAGTYNNPFFGDVVVNVNLTAPALQFNYGYYGKALLQPVSTAREPIVFRLHFFSSIWYQSESDDMKLFSKLGMFDVQFGRAVIGDRSSSNETAVDKLVVFLFDTQKPPIFSKVSN